MKTSYADTGPIHYQLPIGDEFLPLNDYLGRKLTLTFLGEIHCVHCGRKTKKSFSQGYCFPCMQRLAQCDMCLVRPETCHFDKGTCRDPAWGQDHCMIPHTIYLANSSGLKVGITRSYQQMTRWMDQGAVAAIVLAQVPRRLNAGLVEVALKRQVADKTNWRAMLKGEIPDIDLAKARSDLASQIPDNVDAVLADDEAVTIQYPVLEYPKKIVSHNLDKKPLVEGSLMGIKGQYLIFDTGVINIRKYSGYKLSVK